MKSYALLIAATAVYAEGPDPTTQITKFPGSATESDPKTGYTAGSCDVPPADRPLVNTQDIAETDPWSYDQCDSACYQSATKTINRSKDEAE